MTQQLRGENLAGEVEFAGLNADAEKYIEEFCIEKRQIGRLFVLGSTKGSAGLEPQILVVTRVRQSDDAPEDAPVLYKALTNDGRRYVEEEEGEFLRMFGEDCFPIYRYQLSNGRGLVDALSDIAWSTEVKLLLFNNLRVVGAPTAEPVSVWTHDEMHERGASTFVYSWKMHCV